MNKNDGPMPVVFDMMARTSRMPTTPYLSIDLDRVRANYRDIKRLFGERLEVFYAVKANRDPRVLKTLLDEGGCVDVASMTEIRIAADVGFAPSQMVFSNPIKAPGEIEEAYRLGIRLFAADSMAELSKLSKLASGSDIYARLSVSNKGSVWPLTGKFGVEKHDAVRLLLAAKRLGLNPVGTTFHVGSQCLNQDNWCSAIDACADVFDACAERGVALSLLNLGGGLPAMENMTNPPPVAAIAEGILRCVDKRFDPSVRVLMEPGRNMVATAGTLVASVIGEAERQGDHWIYLDVGVYNGLMEIHEKFPYELRTDHPEREKRAYVLAGPTCDSVDVIYHDITLPRLNVGDRVLFMNAGAYTTGYDRYNGFDFPAPDYRG